MAEVGGVCVVFGGFGYFEAHKCRVIVGVSLM